MRDFVAGRSRAARSRRNEKVGAFAAFAGRHQAHQRRTMVVVVAQEQDGDQRRTGVAGPDRNVQEFVVDVGAAKNRMGMWGSITIWSVEQPMVLRYRTAAFSLRISSDSALIGSRTASIPAAAASREGNRHGAEPVLGDAAQFRSAPCGSVRRRSARDFLRHRTTDGASPDPLPAPEQTSDHRHRTTIGTMMVDGGGVEPLRRRRLEPPVTATRTRRPRRRNVTAPATALAAASSCFSQVGRQSDTASAWPSSRFLHVGCTCRFARPRSWPAITTSTRRRDTAHRLTISGSRITSRIPRRSR